MSVPDLYLGREEDGWGVGRLVVGSVDEEVRANLAEWSPRDDYRHWLRSLHRALGGEQAGLVVDWATPSLVEGQDEIFGERWMLFPKEDRTVVLQNQLLATFYFEPPLVPPVSADGLPLEGEDACVQLDEEDEPLSWTATLDELRTLADVVATRLERLVGDGRAGLRVRGA